MFIIMFVVKLKRYILLFLLGLTNSPRGERLLLNDFGIVTKSGGSEVVVLRLVVISSSTAADVDILTPFLILCDLLGYVFVDDSIKLSDVDDVELLETFIVFTMFFFRLLLFLINRFFM